MAKPEITFAFILGGQRWVLPGSRDPVCSESDLVLPLIVDPVLNKSGTSLTRDREGRQNMDNYRFPSDCINDGNVCNKTITSVLGCWPGGGGREMICFLSRLCQVMSG